MKRPIPVSSSNALAKHTAQWRFHTASAISGRPSCQMIASPTTGLKAQPT
jgi:hypothetical protein